MKRIFVPIFLSFSLIGRADTLTLKNGKELKGDVIQDGPDGVLMDYYVTATIKDQKLVPKEDILRLTVVPADQKSFSDLGALNAPATVLDTSFYDALLDKRIPEFLAKYPYSRHLAELRAKQEMLETERSRVRQGDRKIDGAWITSSEIESDPYQATARIQLAAIKEKAQSHEPVAALQGYELIEKTYPGSKVLPDAVDTALIQMEVLQEKLLQARINYDILEKKRQNAIKFAPADQAKEIKDAIDKDAALAKSAVTSAQNDGTKFFPVFPNSKEALDALQTLIDSERTRLLALQKTPMREGLRASDEAFRLVVAGKTQQAKEQMAVAQKLWPANHDLSKLASRFDQIAKAEAAEAARQKAQPSATPSPKK